MSLQIKPFLVYKNLEAAFLTQLTQAFVSVGNYVDTFVGRGGLSTTATDGFMYVPSCEGAPTGVPKEQTGRIPIVVDRTNNKLYFYSNGAWRDAGP